MAEIPPREIQDGIKIRTAIKQDAANLRAHMLRTQTDSRHVVTQPHEYSRNESQQADWIEEHRLSPVKLALVAEFDGGIIGELNFKNFDRERRSHVGAFGMSIHPSFWGRGIGTELIATLLGWARKNPKIEKVGLAVFATNERAIGLYRKMGFLEEGRRPREVRFADNTYVDDILMYQFTD